MLPSTQYAPSSLFNSRAEKISSDAKKIETIIGLRKRLITQLLLVIYKNNFMAHIKFL